MLHFERKNPGRYLAVVLVNEFQWRLGADYQLDCLDGGWSDDRATSSLGQVWLSLCHYRTAHYTSQWVPTIVWLRTKLIRNTKHCVTNYYNCCQGSQQHCRGKYKLKVVHAHKNYNSTDCLLTSSVLISLSTSPSVLRAPASASIRVLASSAWLRANLQWVVAS